MIDSLYGLKFHHWTIEYRLPKQYAECTCDCGSRKAVALSSLRQGMSKSCGCQTGAIISKSKIIHGGSRRGNQTREYNSWRMMKERCFNTKHKHYANYGGRGVRVCKEWSNFSLFLRDMGPRPAGTSLDRRDSNGDYEPSNCRWATRREQSLNRRPYKHTKKRVYKNK